MNSLFTPTIIIKNTQLGKVVSLPKGFDRYFYAEDEKSILPVDMKDTCTGLPLWAFTQETLLEAKFWSQKSIFCLLRESNVQTLLGAKEPS